MDGKKERSVIYFVIFLFFICVALFINSNAREEKPEGPEKIDISSFKGTIVNKVVIFPNPKIKVSWDEAMQWDEKSTLFPAEFTFFDFELHIYRFNPETLNYEYAIKSDFFNDTDYWVGGKKVNKGSLVEGDYIFIYPHKSLLSIFFIVVLFAISITFLFLSYKELREYREMKEA